MIVVLDSYFVRPFRTGIAFSTFWELACQRPRFFFRGLLHYAVELFAVVYFARTETFASFCKAVGLDRKPSNLAWFGVVCALAVRILGHVILINGWSKGVTDYDIEAFKSTLGHERYFYLGPLLLLAPFFEESIYRGFLYKAFRGSFPVGVSTGLISGMDDLYALVTVLCFMDGGFGL